MMHDRCVGWMTSFLLMAMVLCACSPSATEPAPPAVPSETVSPAETATPTPSRTPTAAPTPRGRWIEVDLSDQVVILHDGDVGSSVLSMSSGVGGSPQTTTYVGRYTVGLMDPGPDETAPGVFVANIVLFDFEHMNGFHSQPMDADGTILDDTLGEPASAGCIRLADSRRLFDFARIGTPVIVHE